MMDGQTFLGLQNLDSHLLTFHCIFLYNFHLNEESHTPRAGLTIHFSILFVVHFQNPIISLCFLS